MADLSFALAIADADSDEVLRLEHDAGHDLRFADVDQLAASILNAALTGNNKTLHVERGIRVAKNADTLAIRPLSVGDRAYVDQNFALSHQQARGAWLLPEQASLKVGNINLASYLRLYPWHAMTLATDDVARVMLASTADSVTAWALLVPLFDVLLAPITMRAAGSSDPADTQLQNWATIHQSYNSLGLGSEPALKVFTYRGGWGALDRAGQAHARLSLIDALARYDPQQIASKFRAARVRKLTAATVKKATRGTPLARQILTRHLQPVLSAYFGGDWLSFLLYLGVPPNPNEEIVTALPQPKLYVSGSTKAAAVAAEHGLQVHDVHAMLAAFMGQTTSVSPVEQRTATLTRWWAQFDAAHASQTTGMPALWGLVDSGFANPETAPEQPLYRQLLTSDLAAEIDHQWDGVTLPRWPEAIVSEPYPHRLMAETFGPALKFWEGVALTAWYVCEGPYSRTPLTGLPAYHAHDLAALTDAGTPIHSSLFDELAQAEQQLGPPQQIESYPYELQLPEGTIGIRFSGGGQRREGFDILRDVITRHRQGWTRRYLDEYLRYRWENELNNVARELHRHIAAKGKAPTFRQFARFAADAANHWFNGDLAGLYTAIGEKAPIAPRRVDLLPTTAHQFVHDVYLTLGGQPYGDDLRITDFPAADRFRQISRLASASLKYLQITEALGRPPEPGEFGANRYEWEWADGIERGWILFQNAIEHVRRHP
jgi:hypothetical protein